MNGNFQEDPSQLGLSIILFLLLLLVSVFYLLVVGILGWPCGGQYRVVPSAGQRRHCSKCWRVSASVRAHWGTDREKPLNGNFYRTISTNYFRSRCFIPQEQVALLTDPVETSIIHNVISRTRRPGKKTSAAVTIWVFTGLWQQFELIGVLVQGRILPAT